MNINRKLLSYYLIGLDSNKLINLIEDLLNNITISESYRLDDYIDNIVNFNHNPVKPLDIKNIKELAKDIIYNNDNIDYDSIELYTVSYITGLAQYSYRRTNSTYEEYFTIYLNDDRIKLTD